MGGEVPLPAPERLHVMRGQVLEAHRLHVGAVGDVPRDHLERGQAAAGEDVGVDERPRRLLHLVGAISIVIAWSSIVPSREQLRALGEERADVLPPDGLDHLDRDELVVAAGQVPVSLRRTVTRSPSPAWPTAATAWSYCSREIVVVVTRHPRVAAAWTASAPHPVPISSRWSSGRVEPVADQLELRDLGVLERRRGLAEYRARVTHGPVEHPREQLVPDVVVGGDVPPAPAPRAASQVARARWAGTRTGATNARRRSSPAALRAARRMSAARSGESHRPSA